MTHDPRRGGHTGPMMTALVAVVLDAWTKQWAVAALSPMHVPHEVMGSFLRFTLAFNRGAAFGMHLGEWSRVAFGVIALLILGVLVSLYRETPPSEPWRRYALALVAGGAVGNLIDRIRWDQGVVDFIDIGTSAWRFWTFNIADSAVTVGTILLLWTMREPPVTPAPAPAPSGATEPTT
jgi:signal peptidase II